MVFIIEKLIWINIQNYSFFVHIILVHRYASLTNIRLSSLIPIIILFDIKFQVIVEYGWVQEPMDHTTYGSKIIVNWTSVVHCGLIALCGSNIKTEVLGMIVIPM